MTEFGPETPDPNLKQKEGDKGDREFFMSPRQAFSLDPLLRLQTRVVQKLNRGNCDSKFAVNKILSLLGNFARANH